MLEKRSPLATGQCLISQKKGRRAHVCMETIVQSLKILLFDFQ